MYETTDSFPTIICDAVTNQKRCLYPCKALLEACEERKEVLQKQTVNACPKNADR